MGNLVTKGKAKKEYEAENMKLKIRFQKEGDESGYVLNSVHQQCENFLKELEKINISPEQVQLIDEGLEKRYDSKKPRAERQIIINTKVNVLLCTYLFSLVKKCGNDIKYEISFDLYDKEALTSEVIKMAVADSRHQADIIAESLGKTIIGVNSVNDQTYTHRNMAKCITVDDSTNPEIPLSFRGDTPLSDRAKLPTVTLEEEIEICWNMSE